MAENEDAEGAAAAAPKSGKGKTIALMAIGALALVGVSVGATLLLAGGSSGGDEAEAEEEPAADTEAKPEKKGKKSKKGKKGKEEETKPVQITYLALDPPFVVNFQGAQEARFLQVAMEVMARDPLPIEDVKKHMPAIRNSMVFLLSSQTQEALASAEGKEQLRAEALARIQKILQEYTGKPGVEAVYFTGFVMQ
jgi:flagellar FliL protein